MEGERGRGYKERQGGRGMEIKDEMYGLIIGQCETEPRMTSESMKCDLVSVQPWRMSESVPESISNHFDII